MLIYLILGILHMINGLMARWQGAQWPGPIRAL